MLFLATGKWYVRLKHFVCNKVKIGLTAWKKKKTTTITTTKTTTTTKKQFFNYKKTLELY